MWRDRTQRGWDSYRPVGRTRHILWPKCKHPIKRSSPRIRYLYKNTLFKMWFLLYSSLPQVTFETDSPNGIPIFSSPVPTESSPMIPSPHLCQFQLTPSLPSISHAKKSVHSTSESLHPPDFKLLFFEQQKHFCPHKNLMPNLNIQK